jgi:16S rRNA (adenine1518-N6/adenine1519-N6)-dimethyltransferase
LIDKIVADKIIKAIPDTQEFSLVEIGPGLGDLTKGLMRRGAVEAYEVDEDLYERLKGVFQEEIQNGSLRLRLGDVLEYWDKGELQRRPYWIVANIPYYITTPIIHRALEDANCIGMILMVQKEVAKKLVARERDKEYLALSVLAQTLSDVCVLFDVSPNSFSPPPKVMSAVVKMVKKDDKKGIFQALKLYLSMAFLSPRKTLLKNLSSHYDKEALSSLFDKFGIASNLRPHELSINTHFRLFKNLNV